MQQRWKSKISNYFVWFIKKKNHIYRLKLGKKCSKTSFFDFYLHTLITYYNGFHHNIFIFLIILPPITFLVPSPQSHRSPSFSQLVLFYFTSFLFLVTWWASLDYLQGGHGHGVVRLAAWSLMKPHGPSVFHNRIRTGQVFWRCCEDNHIHCEVKSQRPWHTWKSHSTSLSLFLPLSRFFLFFYDVLRALEGEIEMSHL